jgi:hypothetical protein
MTPDEIKAMQNEQDRLLEWFLLRMLECNLDVEGAKQAAEIERYIRNSIPKPKVVVAECSDVSFEVWLNNTFIVSHHREYWLAVAHANNLRTALGIEQPTKGGEDE